MKKKVNVIAVLCFSLLAAAVAISLTGCRSKAPTGAAPSPKIAEQQETGPKDRDFRSSPADSPSPVTSPAGGDSEDRGSSTPSGAPGNTRPADGGDTAISPEQPPSGAVDDLTGSDQDRTVYSWWYKRTGNGSPPQFDPAAAAMVRGKGYYLGDTSEKKVYLTFDEGYENGFTPKILDILNETGTPAAFFVTGAYAEKQPELIKRIAEESYILGNHTATHPSLPTVTNAEIQRELSSTAEKVKKLTGKNMRFMRPPKGEYNPRVLDEVNKAGYKAVFWSIAYKDWDVNNQPGAKASFDEVINNLHPGAIILLHAVSRSNTEALDDIIKAVRARGYRFASLDEL